jgi:AGZA family xanthine/uracil permease-like MFS transporter
MLGLLVNEDVLDFIPPRHYAAYIFGIMPSIYDWAVDIAARTPIPDGASGEYNTNLTGSSSWFGVLAFKRGSLFISMVWTAIVVKTIDRKWTQVALWCTVAAVFSCLGVIHVPEAGFANFTDSSWEQCDASTEECWQHGEQWTFMTAYLMMGATSLVVNAAKRFDPAIQDEIDDNSRPPFHDWFDKAAVPTEFVANEDRANVRSYLPSLRDIQRYQHSALQDETTQTTTTRSNEPEQP